MVFVVFCCKIRSVAIYAVLPRKLFYRDLPTFYVEKTKARNFVCGEKMTNTMYVIHTGYDCQECLEVLILC